MCDRFRSTELTPRDVILPNPAVSRPAGRRPDRRLGAGDPGQGASQGVTGRPCDGSCNLGQSR